MASKRVYCVALAVLLASLALSRTALTTLEQRRVALGLVASERYENVPPEKALVVALGSFRGWFISYLWIRASRLEQKEQFHESLQLARWITTLQPHFSRVWDFMSWNLAYNIALAHHTPPDRWYWVQQSIELVRDEGIRWNPLVGDLHRTLALLYVRKIGNSSDSFHWYYKESHVREWQRVLGLPAVDARREEALWQRLVAAPRSESELFTEHPEIAVAVQRLAPAETPLDRSLLLRVLAPTTEPGSLASWWQGLASGDAEALLDYLRATTLREHYRMDVSLMADLVAYYGPLDWRHHASHAIYWATQGELRQRHRRMDVRLQPQSPSFVEDQRLLAGAVEIQISLEQLLRGGNIAIAGESITWTPNESYLDAYERCLNTLPGGDTMPGGGVPEELRDLYTDLLLWCLQGCYFADDTARAEIFLERLRRSEERFATSSDAGSALLEDALLRNPDLQSARGACEVLLLEAYLRGIGEQRLPVFERFRDFARRLFIAAGGDEGAFVTLEGETLVELLRSDSGYARPYQKARVWRSLPFEAREALRELVPFLRDQARRAGLLGEELFPEP